jgi:putative transposase
MTDLAARTFILAMVDEAKLAGARQWLACEAIGMQVRTLQRWRREPTVGDLRPTRVQQPANKLDDLERQRILAVANSAEFGHLPPSQIVPRLADQGTYVASESTFYRVLTAANQVKHRNAARPTAESSKPRAVRATGPNQLYSWDITYLPTTVRGVYFYLYMFMDIYSRKIVGWQVYDEENTVLAAEVVRDICTREKIQPGQVVLHSDNGSPMKGATMLATLQRLGVVPSFSRPAVSNDNPYSESLFKTLKYRPGYPEKTFSELVHARRWVTQFADWYNNEHRHSAIRFVTPAQRHGGKDDELLRRREAVYEAAKARHPGRWSGETRNWEPVRVVHLNPAKSANYDSHRRAA